MSATIYDNDDRPIDSLWPRSFSWFGADRQPLAANAAQVPHTSTGYDANIVGPSVAWYDFQSTTGSFVNAPRLHNWL